MKKEEIEKIRKSFIESHEPDTFVRNQYGVLIYYSQDGSNGLNLEVFFDELIEHTIQSLTEPTPSSSVSAEELRRIDEEDIVEKLRMEHFHRYKHLGGSVDHNLITKHFQEGCYAILKELHTYANQTREEELKKHAVGFYFHNYDGEITDNLVKVINELYQEYLNRK